MANEEQLNRLKQLEAVLESAKILVGQEKHAQCDELIRDIRKYLEEKS